MQETLLMLLHWQQLCYVSIVYQFWGWVFWSSTENFRPGQSFLTLRWMEMPLGNVINEGSARIWILFWEKLSSLAFLLLMALKPACSEREAGIQGYLDTQTANIGQGDSFMLFNKQIMVV